MNPPAWLEMSAVLLLGAIGRVGGARGVLPESLLVEIVPVVYRAVHDADIYEVKVVGGPCPVLKSELARP